MCHLFFLFCKSERFYYAIYFTSIIYIPHCTYDHVFLQEKFEFLYLFLRERLILDQDL